jgi:ArsR family transcriptional regulator
VPDEKPVTTRLPADDDPLCDLHLVHEEAVRAAMDGRAADEEVEYLADTFQALASPTRLRIVEALGREELCVCDLAAVAGVSESAVSHHLRQLRQMRIVRYRKEGRMAFYRLDDTHVRTLFGIGLDHVRD